MLVRQKDFSKKTLDKHLKICYSKYRKGQEKQTKNLKKVKKS